METKLMRKAMTPKEAASMYGFSEGTLANMRCNKKGPRFYKRGRKVLYLVADFEQWLTEHPVMTVDCFNRSQPEL